MTQNRFNFFSECRTTGPNPEIIATAKNIQGQTGFDLLNYIAFLGILDKILRAKKPPFMSPPGNQIERIFPFFLEKFLCHPKNRFYPRGIINSTR